MRLESGRKYLWQWEKDQKLKVPAGCTQVHFANGTSAEALVVDVKNGMADIPNILLQVAAFVRCYAWDGNDVITHAMFDVLPREKPSDYIYTETEVRRYEKLEAGLNTRSQGRSAKYSFTTPGWKRVLNIIRGSGGMLNFCFGQSYPLYMAQVAGIMFSGFVKYGNDKSNDAKPVIYQMYNNIFGEDEALKNPGSITKVRIGYPDPNQEKYDNGTANAIRNPINCYLDVYVDFDKAALSSVGFQMNYAGYADSHNCKAITAETDAVDTGVYGEKLLYHELTLDENCGISMKDQGIRAAEISADRMSVGGKQVITDVDNALSGTSTNPVQNKVVKKALDDVQKEAKTGKSQVQFAFKASNISTPLLFAGISSNESAAYLKDTDTKTPFLNASGEPIDKKEAGAYVMAGVYGDFKTGALHAKIFDAETDLKIKGKSVIDDAEIGGSAWSSKHIVNRLCPSFSKSGTVVTCEPLEGYPLSVISTIEKEDISSITLHQENEDESRDYTVDLPFGVTDGAFYWTTGELIIADDETIQLTPQVITALHGENTFTSDSGDTTVSGKMDPNVYWAKKFAEQESELAKLNKQYELIEDVTLDEAVASFTRTADTNGNPYNFSAIRIRIVAPVATAAAQIIFAIGNNASNYFLYHQAPNGLRTSATATNFVARNDNGLADYYVMTGVSATTIGNCTVRDGYVQQKWGNVTRISLTTYQATVLFPAGTKITIYGIRG